MSFCIEFFKFVGLTRRTLLKLELENIEFSNSSSNLRSSSSLSSNKFSLNPIQISISWQHLEREYILSQISYCKCNIGWDVPIQKGSVLFSCSYLTDQLFEFQFPTFLCFLLSSFYLVEFSYYEMLQII